MDPMVKYIVSWLQMAIWKAMTRYDTQNSSVYVQIAHGKQCTVAEKEIRLEDPRDEQIASNEVETLEQRKHPNIVPLSASYTLTEMETETPVTTMHLIFPFANMDLEEWMTNPQPPDCLQGLPRSERRDYLYRCIYALVSGLSFLHREQGGIITAHHDLKPHNILVFEQELKLADLGRSHLRPSAEGSETENKLLGTYGYQPPEFWDDDGLHAPVKHGRMFDVWMGCIIIELATLIVYDWEGDKVIHFREKRQKNPTKTRPKLLNLVRRQKGDKSFHNNWVVVKDWIRHLQVEDPHPKLKSTLNVALRMLDGNPSSRPFPGKLNWIYTTYKTLMTIKSLLDLHHPPIKFPMAHKHPCIELLRQGTRQDLFNFLSSDGRCLCKTTTARQQ